MAEDSGEFGYFYRWIFAWRDTNSVKISRPFYTIFKRGWPC